MPKFTRPVFNALQHLEKNLPKTGPLLLGISGGPDSLALFFLLLNYCKMHAIHFGAAHIDHSWREGSDLEANQLKHLCKIHDIPFHLHTEPAPQFLVNLEKKGREIRYAFFKKIMEQKCYLGLILGHHKNDQAETVLKRCLEGAPLAKIGAMQCVSSFQKWPLYRPLLHMTKEEIYTLLPKLTKMLPIEDPTNLSDRFLRGRMRQTLLPLIESSLGKSVISPLNQLAEEAHEIREMVEKQIEPMIASAIYEKEKISIDFHPFFPLCRFEIKSVIRKLTPKSLNRVLIDQITTLILDGKKRRLFNFALLKIKIDRRRLSFEREIC